MKTHKNMFISGPILEEIERLKLERRLAQWKAENGGRGRHITVPIDMIPEVLEIRARARAERAESRLKAKAAEIDQKLKAVQRSAGLSA